MACSQNPMRSISQGGVALRALATWCTWLSQREAFARPGSSSSLGLSGHTMRTFPEFPASKATGGFRKQAMLRGTFRKPQRFDVVDRPFRMKRIIADFLGCPKQSADLRRLSSKGLKNHPMKKRLRESREDQNASQRGPTKKRRKQEHKHQEILGIPSL